MKIEIVYTSKSKHIKKVTDEMARWVKTYAKPICDYHYQEPIDLMVIGFDDTILKDKELIDFISSLNRKQVKNLVLVNAFFINNKKMHDIIDLCHKTNLPLLREQYTYKLTLSQLKYVDPSIIDSARLYIEDMVNIVRNYY